MPDEKRCMDFLMERSRTVDVRQLLELRHIDETELVAFWASKGNHQITPPVHGGAEDSVRLTGTD